jgi:hypothetical protein
VVIAQINSLTPERYDSCCSLARVACHLGSGLPVELLKSLSHLSSSGVDQFGVGYDIFIHVEMCLANDLSMKVLMLILM